MNGTQKAAILIATLGEQAAAAVMKRLPPAATRRITQAMAGLRSIPNEHLAAVHEEAYRWLGGRDGLLVDGREQARALLKEVLGPGAAEEEAVLGGAGGAAEEAPGERVAAALERVPPPLLGTLLQSEHPQVAAFVLAQLRPAQAAEVLATLPEDLQGDLVLRVAALGTVPPEAAAGIEGILRRQVRGLAQSPARGARGAKIAAEIVNCAGQVLEAQILSRLEADAPELAEEVRKLMFTFEDLVRLDNRGMQTLLKEVAREDLILALKTASPALREKIFSNVSSRAGEILKEDMAAMGPVRLKEVEKAQASIVAVLRRLQEEQKVVVAGSGGDDVLV